MSCYLGDGILLRQQTTEQDLEKEVRGFRIRIQEGKFLNG